MLQALRGSVLNILESAPPLCPLPGDPHMTGFLGQKFDFTGEDGEWYALIADGNMNINMRVSCPVADLPEITYITGTPACCKHTVPQKSGTFIENIQGRDVGGGVRIIAWE